MESSEILIRCLFRCDSSSIVSDGVVFCILTNLIALDKDNPSEKNSGTLYNENEWVWLFYAKPESVFEFKLCQCDKIHFQIERVESIENFHQFSIPKISTDQAISIELKWDSQFDHEIISIDDILNENEDLFERLPLNISNSNEDIAENVHDDDNVNYLQCGENENTETKVSPKIKFKVTTESLDSICGSSSEIEEIMSHQNNKLGVAIPSKNSSSDLASSSSGVKSTENVSKVHELSQENIADTSSDKKSSDNESKVTEQPEEDEVFTLMETEDGLVDIDRFLFENSSSMENQNVTTVRASVTTPEHEKSRSHVIIAKIHALLGFGGLRGKDHDKDKLSSPLNNNKPVSDNGISLNNNNNDDDVDILIEKNINEDINIDCHQSSKEIVNNEKEDHSEMLKKKKLQKILLDKENLSHNQSLDPIEEQDDNVKNSISTHNTKANFKTESKSLSENISKLTDICYDESKEFFSLPDLHNKIENKSRKNVNCLNNVKIENNEENTVDKYVNKSSQSIEYAKDDVLIKEKEILEVDREYKSVEKSLTDDITDERLKNTSTLPEETISENQNQIAKETESNISFPNETINCYMENENILPKKLEDNLEKENINENMTDFVSMKKNLSPMKSENAIDYQIQLNQISENSDKTIQNFDPENYKFGINLENTDKIIIELDNEENIETKISDILENNDSTNNEKLESTSNLEIEKKSSRENNQMVSDDKIKNEANPIKELKTSLENIVNENFVNDYKNNEAEEQINSENLIKNENNYINENRTGIVELEMKSFEIENDTEKSRQISNRTSEDSANDFMINDRMKNTDENEIEDLEGNLGGNLINKNISEINQNLFELNYLNDDCMKNEKNFDDETINKINLIDNNNVQKENDTVNEQFENLNIKEPNQIKNFKNESIPDENEAAENFLHKKIIGNKELQVIREDEKVNSSETLNDETTSSKIDQGMENVFFTITEISNNFVENVENSIVIKQCDVFEELKNIDNLYFEKIQETEGRNEILKYNNTSEKIEFDFLQSNLTTKCKSSPENDNIANFDSHTSNDETIQLDDGINSFEKPQLNKLTKSKQPLTYTSIKNFHYDYDIVKLMDDDYNFSIKSTENLCHPNHITSKLNLKNFVYKYNLMNENTESKNDQYNINITEKEIINENARLQVESNESSLVTSLSKESLDDIISTDNLYEKFTSNTVCETTTTYPNQPVSVSVVSSQETPFLEIANENQGIEFEETSYSGKVKVAENVCYIDRLENQGCCEIKSIDSQLHNYSNTEENVCFINDNNRQGIHLSTNPNVISNFDIDNNSNIKPLDFQNNDHFKLAASNPVFHDDCLENPSMLNSMLCIFIKDTNQINLQGHKDEDLILMQQRQFPNNKLSIETSLSSNQDSAVICDSDLVSDSQSAVETIVQDDSFEEFICNHPMTTSQTVDSLFISALSSTKQTISEENGPCSFSRENSHEVIFDDTHLFPNPVQKNLRPNENCSLFVPHKSKMKRSPALEGVCDLLKKTDSELKLIQQTYTFVNDDDLYPDAVTPTKADSTLRLKGSIYDFPYIDDESGYSDSLFNPFLDKYYKRARLADCDECTLASNDDLSFKDSIKKSPKQPIIINTKKKSKTRNRFFRLCGCLSRNRN